MESFRKVMVVLPAVGVGEGVASVVRDAAVAAYALRTRGMDLEIALLGDPDSEEAATKAAVKFDVPLAARPAASLTDAYRGGFRWALERADAGAADLLVTLDATGQHDVSHLPHMIDQLCVGSYDVVIGSRWAKESGTPGLTMSRWMLGRLANRSFRMAAGVRGITDATTAFRVARLDVLRRLDLDSLPDDPRGIQMAFVANAIAHGCRVAESPIIYQQPPNGALAPISRSDISSFIKCVRDLRTQTRDVRKTRLSPQGRKFTYHNFGAAGDLERLGTADRFFGWTLDEFRPYLRGRVLEVGAGLGTITRKLVEADKALEVVALEPAENLFGQLHAYASVTPQVVASRLTSGDYVQTDADQFDTVMYINVLEHIEDDVKELQVAAQSLRPGGHVLVFGPGMPSLYSELDYNAGHYRRYTVPDLRRVAHAAGLEVISLRYFDVLGVLPYYLVYRLLRSQAISGSTMWGYDRVLVPLSRTMQRLLRKPPLGKNVIMVARKR